MAILRSRFVVASVFVLPSFLGLWVGLAPVRIVKWG